MTDGNYNYCGKHFLMYIIVKSACYVPETTIILSINYTSVKKSKGIKVNSLRYPPSYVDFKVWFDVTVHRYRGPRLSRAGAEDIKDTQDPLAHEELLVPLRGQGLDGKRDE